MPKEPNRGEVWLVDLGMAAKVRPCLVVSIPTQDQDRALVTLVAHTTSRYGSRFEVEIETDFLNKLGVFDAQNLITIPRGKLIRVLGKLEATQMECVVNTVRIWLGIPEA